MIYQLCQFACDPVAEPTFRDEVTRCRELWNSCKKKKKKKHWDALWSWEEKM